MSIAGSSAIVLAGGRSSRFGAEKMTATLEGVPLLHLALRAVAQACDEVLVVGAPSGLPVELPGDSAHSPMVILDVDPYEGPLVALVHAAGFATRNRLLLVGGDMPRLQPAILRRVLAWGEGSDAACLVVDGWTQPFPMGLDRAAAIEHGARLVDAGERSLRRLISSLGVELVPEEDWRSLDPGALSLRDIDRPEDLDPATNET
ncbi:MAG: molybdenum cofactor guanylyltransferase [Chloroflexota bacterium]